MWTSCNKAVYTLFLVTRMGTLWVLSETALRSMHRCHVTNQPTSCLVSLLVGSLLSAAGLWPPPPPPPPALSWAHVLAVCISTVIGVSLAILLLQSHTVGHIHTWHWTCCGLNRYICGYPWPVLKLFAVLCARHSRFLWSGAWESFHELMIEMVSRKLSLRSSQWIAFTKIPQHLITLP